MDCPNSTFNGRSERGDSPANFQSVLIDARPKCSKQEQSPTVFPDLFQKESSADRKAPIDDIVPSQDLDLVAADKGKRKGVLDKVPAPDLQRSIEAFTKQHKIDVTQSNGWLTYSLDAHGRTGVLFRTAASDFGLREAEVKLRTMVDARQKQIEQRYAVKFAAPGDIVDYQRPTEEGVARQRIVHAVQPELYQLEGLMSGLEKSGPTSFAVGAQDMKLYFLSEKVVLDKPGHASYQNDRTGVPSIYFFPSINEVDKPTESDLSNADQKKSQADKSRPETIESITMHQMGHHQFVKMGYKNGVEGEIFQSNIGWVRNRDWNTVKTQWLILGKSVDADGTNSSYFPSIDATGATSWVRTKPDGGGVDSRGRRVPIVQAERLTPAEMREKALIKPPTLNFNSPEDEYSESVRLHRLGEASRRELIRSSPYVYDQVKANDQKEIDDKYGKKATDGSSKYLRAPGGQLVDNDDLNQLQIQSFEILSMYPDLRFKK